MSGERPASLEHTQVADPQHQPGADEGAPRMAAFDAARLRAAVAGRLFGADAEPVKIGRYTVLKRLGAGGMGIVYSAYDDALDRKVAIKLLRGAETDELRRARLVREAQALARVSHPNVIHVYEVGEFRGQVFVAMEFVRGKTLDDVALPPEGDRDLEQVLDAFTQAGHGLAAAHAAGLVHRDFKPENALIDGDGRVRVLDFGLARAADEANGDDTTIRPTSLDADDAARLSNAVNSSTSIDAPLTQTGAIMGTPAYMAPEQHLGRRTDARTDQFSFCVSLWEKLYGERPFKGGTMGELSLNVTNGRVVEPPSNRGVPKFIHRAIHRGLSLDPQSRFPSMDALLEALSFERRRKRRFLGGAIGVALIGAGVAGWAGSRTVEDPCAGGEDKLARIWDGATQKAIHDAFSNSGVEYSDAAWNATRTQLDDYTGAWVAMHRRACEAAMVDKVESSEQYGRRLVCLGQRLAEVEQLTSFLRNADSEMVDRAVSAASNLGEIQRCADESALATISEGVDDETRGRLASLDRAIARGNTRLELGKFDQAREAADQAVAEAAALDDPAREARALLLAGRARSELRDLDAAEEQLRLALRRADVARDDEARVEAGVMLIRVVGYQKREFEAAEAIAHDAEAALERLGRAPLLRASLEQQLGSMYRRRGDYGRAVESMQRALSIRMDELGDRHADVALTHNNLGNALSANGRYEDAERELRLAMVGFEELLGDGHPYLGYTLNNLAAVILERGREQGRPEARAVEAEALTRRALTIRERVYGKDHPGNASRHHNLGEALRYQGKFDEAAEAFARALRLKESIDDLASKAASLTGLGEVELERGRTETALTHLEQAVSLMEAEGAPENRAEAQFALAGALARPGEQQDLVRARSLGDAAATQYAKAGAAYDAELNRVRAWLATVPASVSVPSTP